MHGFGGLALITVLAAAAAGEEPREREAGVEALRPQHARPGDGPAAESKMMANSILLGAPFSRVQQGKGSLPDPVVVRAAFSSRLGGEVVDSYGEWQFEDLVLEALDGCALSYYEFDLAGQLSAEEEFEPFTVEFGLYRGCKLFAEDSTDGLIVGTGGTLTIAEGGPTTVVVIPQRQVLLPGVLWLGVRFSRGSAGLIVGGAPEVGHSTPGVGWAGAGSCFRDRLGYTESGTIQPFFNVRLFVPATCPKTHPVYANSRSGICSTSKDSQGEWLVDDALLEGGPCLMRAYEFTVMEPGVYDTELRTACDGSAIGGTQRSEFVKAPGQTRVRHTFNPPIPLPEQVWIAGRNLPEAGSFGLAGRPPIGDTNSGLCLPESTSSLGLAASIYCDGEPPLGACCDMHKMQCAGGSNESGRCETNEHCLDGRCEPRCREVIRANCPYEGRDGTNLPEWKANAACDPDPFAATCGVAACCTTLYGCLDLTQRECEEVTTPDAGAYWDNEFLCSASWFDCAPPACMGATSACMVSHGEPGCQNWSCCQQVCQMDPWCCQVEWDRSCVELVAETCWLREHRNCHAGGLGLGSGAMELALNTSHLLAKADSYLVWQRTCLGKCEGGSRSASYCLGDVDCPPDGQCMPASRHVRNPTWMRFQAPGTSVRISTCQSENSSDSVIVLYRATDGTSLESECGSLVVQACAFGEGCGDGQQSCLCVTDLVPGETYYVMHASTGNSSGDVFRIDVSAPCLESTCVMPNDCNGNGQRDLLDVIHGVSMDCQDNLIPDECEVLAGADCNANLIPDDCELRLGMSPDCNDNMQPDECDVSEQVSQDCDANLVPDECQEDCDDNGEPDACELLAGAPVDCDGDGRIDVCQPLWDSLPAVPSAWVTTPAKASAFDSDTFVFFGFEAKLTIARLRQGTWFEDGVYYPLPGGQYNGFGQSAFVDDVWIFAGAPGGLNDQQVASGVVHAYERVSDTWIPAGLLAPDNPQAGSSFGWSLSENDGVLAVGGPTAPGGGAAFVFERVGRNWMQRQELRPPNQTPGMRFGQSVSVSGAVLVVSQGINESESRAAHVFRQRGSTWVYERPVHIATGPVQLLLATSVSLAGSDMALGVPRTPATGPDRGHVFLFSLYDPELNPRWALQATSGDSGFGSSVSISADALAVGATAGSMSIYRRELGRWTFKTRRTSAAGGIVQTDGVTALAGATVIRLAPGDCNNNRVQDPCDIGNGLAADCNGNRAPDRCDETAAFDRDFDLDVDLTDFARMQGCFTGPEGALSETDCCRIFDPSPIFGAVDATDYAGFYGAMVGP